MHTNSLTHIYCGSVQFRHVPINTESGNLGPLRSQTRKCASFFSGTAKYYYIKIPEPSNLLAASRYTVQQMQAILIGLDRNELCCFLWTFEMTTLPQINLEILKTEQLLIETTCLNKCLHCLCSHLILKIYSSMTFRFAYVFWHLSHTAGCIS